MSSLILPPDLAKAAEEKLGETPEKRAECLLELRNRLQTLPADQQPHRMDDEYLVAYLRGTKYRLDVAEKKIKSMEAFR